MSKLPQLIFDTENFDVEERVDAFRDVWRNYLSFKIAPEAAVDFHARSNIWWFGECTLVHSFGSPMTCARSLHSYEDWAGLVSIALLKKGHQINVYEDKVQHQSTDVVHIRQANLRTHWNYPTDYEAIYLFMPAARLGYMPGQTVPSRTFAASSSVGRILSSLLLSLSDTLEKNDRDEAGVLAESIYGLMDPLMREVADLRAEVLASRKRLAIERYIQDNISDHTLSPENLATRFALSRASLYRLFDDTGGIKSYISECRVKRIYADLSRSVPRRGIVRVIAERYGYYDMTQFNRVFRRHIGVTPGSIAGLIFPDSEIPFNPSEAADFDKPIILSKPAHLL